MKTRFEVTELTPQAGLITWYSGVSEKKAYAKFEEHCDSVNPVQMVSIEEYAANEALKKSREQAEQLIKTRSCAQNSAQEADR